MAENDINSEEMPELYGKVAKEAWGDALKEKSPGRRHLLEEQAKHASHAYVDQVNSECENDTYGCQARFIMLMPITWQQKCILSRIWSFQRGGGEGCYMSIKKLAEELGCEAKNLHHQIAKLTDAGYLLKFSNGRPRPATYMLDKIKCLEAAKANGWKPYQNPAEKQEDEAKQG